MLIFYCCGVLESQKKIWWKNLLSKRNNNSSNSDGSSSRSDSNGVSVTKKFSQAVTHVVCGRVDANANQVRRATTDSSLKGVWVVKASWLAESVRVGEFVSEKDHELILDDSLLPFSSSKRERVELDMNDTSLMNTKRLKESPSYENQLPPPAPSVSIGPFRVAPFGIGTLAWGVTYPDPLARPNQDIIADFVEAAVSLSIPHNVLIDTADTYCTDEKDIGYVEGILGQLCDDRKFEPTPILATKGGMRRIGSDHSSWREASFNTADEWETCIRESLIRLKCNENNPLPIWQVHHCKSQNLKAVMLACRKLVASNLITSIGLCNVTVAEVEYCQQFLPIVSVQNPYSFWHRTAEKPIGKTTNTKRGMLEYCKKNQIIFIAYGFLGGLSARRGENKWTQFPQLLNLAMKKEVNVCILALAMIRYIYPHVLPLVGTRRLDHIHSLKMVGQLRFTQEELSMFPSI